MNLKILPKRINFPCSSLSFLNTLQSFFHLSKYAGKLQAHVNVQLVSQVAVNLAVPHRSLRFEVGIATVTKRRRLSLGI